MNFNLVSKNNLGAVGALMLVILLTQSRIFNFLLDTTLGRFALIIMLILISYANKIFGVVTVLLIIVLFNVSDIAYLEGFDGNKDNNEKKDENVANNKEDENDTNMKKKIYVTTNAKADSSEGQPVSEETTATTTTTTTETTATEGFNILGMENEFKRGKNSNSIPVSYFMNSSDSVLPYDPSTNSENFSSL